MACIMPPQGASRAAVTWPLTSAQRPGASGRPHGTQSLAEAWMLGGEVPASHRPHGRIGGRRPGASGGPTANPDWRRFVARRTRYPAWAPFRPWSPGQMSNVGSAAKPIPGRFHPIQSPSTKTKTPHKQKGIVTDLNASRRRRFDSKNRGFCSRIKRLDVTPLRFHRSSRKRRDARLQIPAATGGFSPAPCGHQNCHGVS